MEEELRQTAISRHIQGGESPKDVYTSLNRSKKWFFKWLIRYRTGAPDWFKEQSRAPKNKSLGDRSQGKGADSFNEATAGGCSLCPDWRLGHQMGAQETGFAVSLGQHDQPGAEARGAR